MDFSTISVREHLFPLVVFCFAVAIGIELTIGHFRALLAKPLVPILGTLVHTVTFPALAVGLVSLVLFMEFPLEEHLLIGILLVAACPSGGFSNMLVLLARADLALSVLLTAVSSVLSFATVPFFFWIFAEMMPQLSGSVELPVVDTLVSLLLMVVIPVGVGMIWRHYREDFVVPRIKMLQSWMQFVLYSVLVVMLIQDWDNISAGVGPALPWSLGLCITALATGYGFSRIVGLNPVDSFTVAVEGSIRNLAVAFLIATSVLGRLDVAVLPSVYFMAVLIVGLSVARFWRVQMAPRFAQGVVP